MYVENDKVLNCNHEDPNNYTDFVFYVYGKMVNMIVSHEQMPMCNIMN